MPFLHSPSLPQSAIPQQGRQFKADTQLFWVIYAASGIIFERLISTALYLLHDVESILCASFSVLCSSFIPKHLSGTP
jgi:hypothetical protein